MPDPQPSNVSEIQRAVSIDFIRNSGGFAVKALKGQKEPAKGWDPKTNTEARSQALMAQLASSDDNLGIHLHGNLVDVDVDSDSPHLTQALDAFLPACAHVWGRKSRPRTHRAYLIRGEPFDPAQYPFLRRLNKISEAKVELRGGPQTRGEYSLLPGSIHPSGETYEWSDIRRARSSVSVTDVALLVRSVRLAGAVAVLAPHWIEGARNDLTMAISGFLSRAFTVAEGMGEAAFRLDRDQSRRFLEVLLEVAEDDSSDKNARLQTFEKTWDKMEAGTVVTGATRIQEITGDNTIVAKLYTLLADSPDVAAIEAFLSRFAIWQGPGVVVDMDLAAAGEKAIMTRQAFSNSFGHCFIQGADGKNKLLPEMLFHMKATVRVTGVTFEPGLPLLVDTRTGRKVNQWCGFDIQPWNEPVTKEDVAPFLNYMWEVVCDRDKGAYEWVMGWLANIFQHPADKPKTALVLVGKPGAGKSVLGNSILIPIIGEQHAAAVNSIESVIKDFNIAFDNKIFIQCDEATNNRQRTQAARLKALISDPKKLVEPKGVDAFHKPNHSRFMFTSNDVEDAIYLNDGMDDRRYTILEVSSRYKDDVETYWHPYLEWLGFDGLKLNRRDNLAKVHRYLKDHQYDQFRIMRPYFTAAKQTMQQRSWDIFDGWLAAWVARNHPLSERNHLDWHDAPIGDSKHIDRTDWPGHISLTALTRDHVDYCRTQNRRGNEDLFNEHQMAQQLKRRGLDVGSGNRVRVTEFDEKKNRKVEKRVRIYKMPKRVEVEEYLKGKYGYLSPDEDNAGDVDARVSDDGAEF